MQSPTGEFACSRLVAFFCPGSCYRKGGYKFHSALGPETPPRRCHRPQFTKSKRFLEGREADISVLAGSALIQCQNDALGPGGKAGTRTCQSGTAL